MIREILEELAPEKFRTDTRYREGHLKVLNALPGREVLGLHSAEMKAVARRLSEERGQKLIAAFESASPADLCYEEVAVWRFIINHEKCSVERKFAMLDNYVPAMDNWGVCDSYVSHAKWMKKLSPETLWTWLDKWYSSSREFELRFALVVSMCYLLDSRLDDIFSRLDALDITSISSDYRYSRTRPQEVQAGCVPGPEPYYVRMAVAWLLATALAKYPDETREYLRNSNLPQDILKLYVRKARESFRTRSISPF